MNHVSITKYTPNTHTLWITSSHSPFTLLYGWVQTNFTLSHFCPAASLEKEPWSITNKQTNTHTNKQSEEDTRKEWEREYQISWLCWCFPIAGFLWVSWRLSWQPVAHSGRDLRTARPAVPRRQTRCCLCRLRGSGTTSLAAYMHTPSEPPKPHPQHMPHPPAWQ